MWNVLLLFILTNVPLTFTIREEEMVSTWAEKLGDELWELGTTVTKSPEIRTSYTKLNARVLPTDGEGILKNILKNVGRFVKQKIDSVKCLIAKAEELHLNVDESELVLENYTYYSSMYSPTINELGEMTDYERNDGAEVNMSFYREIELKEEGQFYGLPVNTSLSSVHVPVDVYDQGPNVISSIYWSEKLDETFKNNYVTDSSISWQYFCSSDGFLRHFPALHWYSEEDTFDCRSRFWFIEAATCAKDVVILVDHSGSMNDIKKTIARITVKSVLDTLSNNDFMNVIIFNKTLYETVPCFPKDMLVQATPENIKMFKDSLTNFTPDDKADISGAFIHAFKLLEKYRNIKPCPTGECTQMIVLITDGVAENLTDIFIKYNQLNNGSITPVRVFVYVVGREASNLGLAKMIACQNKGYFAHLKYTEEVRGEVLKYALVLARPLVLQRSDRPLSWTHMFVDALGIDEEGPSEGRMMTSVSGPVFDLRSASSDAKRTANLLGVIGTDVEIMDIQKLTLPYKIGANGYAFLLSNNGYLLFHPDLRSMEHGVLKENYNSVDLTEVELYDDDNTELREPNDEILKLRAAMVSQEEGAMPNMKMKFHYDNMRRVGTEIRNYYYTPLNNTPFTLGLVLPYSYGSYWIKAGDEIKKSLQMGIPLTDHFRGNWKIHPDWVYCDYHKSSHWFSTPEEKLNHFLEKMFNIHEWKWKEQFPDEEFNSNDAESENCERNPIKNEDYYCDRDLMQLLVFDAKVTENSFKDSQWSAKNRREEELVNQFGVSLRFVASQSGLTRWQHIPQLEEGARSFGDSHHLSLEESWYKSAVLFHQIDPDAFVFSVPFNAGLMSDTTVTATYAIFPRDGGNEAPGCVVGFKMKHETLFDRFMAITSKTKCRECLETCSSDTLDCYVIDANGYVILSEIANDTGRFFGELEGAVMEAMVAKNIFRRIPMFDYQGICFLETIIKSGGDILKAPLRLAKELLYSFFTKILWILIQFNQLLPAYAQISDDYDLILEKANNENIDILKPTSSPEDRYEYIPELCDRQGDLFLLQPANKEQAVSTVTVNCSRPFYLKRIPRTNLVLIVVNTLYQSCYRKLSAHMERVLFSNPHSQLHGCQKLAINSLPRSQPTPCFTSHPLENEILSCGGQRIYPISNILWLFILFFLI